MKITQRELNGYMFAKKEWISDNDEYNKSKFGITKDLYCKINRACIDAYGISGYYPVLKEVNKRL